VDFVSEILRRGFGVLYLFWALGGLSRTFQSPDAPYTPLLVKIVTETMFLSIAVPLLVPRRWIWLGLGLASASIVTYATFDAMDLRGHPQSDERIAVICFFVAALILGICSYLSFKKLKRTHAPSADER